MSGNHPREFRKRSLLIISVHNEPFSVASMCVCNPDCSPALVHSWFDRRMPEGSPLVGLIGPAAILVLIALSVAAFIYNNIRRRK
jgi:hypothetical protein